MNNFMLTANSHKSISLKTLLAELNPYNLECTIVIEPSNTIDIIDDLIDINDQVINPIIKHKLEFVLNTESRLNYFVHTTSKISQKLENKSHTQKNTTIIEKELIFKLIGPGANAQVNGRCFVNSSSIFKFKTLQDHQSEDTTSNVLIKGVLDDSARLNVSSMIHIQNNAQRANAQQANKNLILSKNARAISIPQLEIKANNVMCKHGAALSNINHEQSFYLQSRGLDIHKARRLLIDGFLAF